jgi:hypothetical protein
VENRQSLIEKPIRYRVGYFIAQLNHLPRLIAKGY